jgi:CheY-like chemotaxis protein
MHGGTVHVYSAGENKGSTFVVRLPLLIQSKEQEEATELRRSAQTLETDSNLSLDGMLILVVDDEEDTRQLLVQSLTFYGATVITAESAAEAYDALQEKNPDVMVSDIGMPDEDGYSLIRRIRALSNKQQRDTPAVALTAFTRAQDRMRALTSGYQNHVAKPVEPDELATVIASLTGRLLINNEN